MDHQNALGRGRPAPAQVICRGQSDRQGTTLGFPPRRSVACGPFGCYKSCATHKGPRALARRRAGSSTVFRADRRHHAVRRAMGAHRGGSVCPVSHIVLSSTGAGLGAGGGRSSATGTAGQLLGRRQLTAQAPAAHSPSNPAIPVADHTAPKTLLSARVSGACVPSGILYSGAGEWGVECVHVCGGGGGGTLGAASCTWTGRQGPKGSMAQGWSPVHAPTRLFLQHNLSTPFSLQRYIVRIIFLVPVYAMASWPSLVAPSSAVYITAVRDMCVRVSPMDLLQSPPAYLRRQRRAPAAYLAGRMQRPAGVLSAVHAPDTGPRLPTVSRSADPPPLLLPPVQLRGAGDLQLHVAVPGVRGGPRRGGDQDGRVHAAAVLDRLHLLPAAPARERPVRALDQAGRAAVCDHQAYPGGAGGGAVRDGQLRGGQLVAGRRLHLHHHHLQPHLLHRALRAAAVLPGHARAAGALPAPAQVHPHQGRHLPVVLAGTRACVVFVAVGGGAAHVRARRLAGALFARAPSRACLPCAHAGDPQNRSLPPRPGRCRASSSPSATRLAWCTRRRRA